MLHLFPDSSTATPLSGEPYAEAVTRLASIRHALRLVDPFAGPAPDEDGDCDIAAVWPTATEAKRSVFDTQSARTASGAAAGIEALLAARAAGFEPHQAASTALVDEIRRELDAVSRMMLG
ncbi:hypothetical protein G7077_09850 [Sphingomonas piscis]|uniref:Uncharacterized protein n=1 Tax=Sphingomonas piscis TaxID=2714943 RepID=A0A6G7YQZ8_9SPHN|nr:hypothetical protein [Sphingomonas piscis]QIK79154.1 hypothetical protein G7077_09850 [Sphingomonas piscis]